MMALFGSMYQKVIGWAKHRHATYYLSATSFAESSFFPIPVDVLLAPMVLARRDKAWWYAALATFWSVAGAVLGYYIGMFLFDQVAEPIIEFYSLQEQFREAQELFDKYGIWIIFIAGFSPIPYKISTITAGVVVMPLLPFILASIVARAARFFLVAWLIWKFGPHIKSFIDRYFNLLAIAFTVLLIGGFVAVKYLF